MTVLIMALIRRVARWNAHDQKSRLLSGSVRGFHGSHRVLRSSASLDGPSRPTRSWERSAKMVQNVDVSDRYLERIRADHDPSQHLKTLEEELRGTMGKALGDQGEKVLRALRNMREQWDRHRRLLEDHPATAPPVLECAKQHNFHRERAMTARWELIVHRQAIGLLVDNHKFVCDQYPIGPALPETIEQVAKMDEQRQGGATVASSKTAEPNLTGQLDWWQRVGRWR